MRRPNAIRLPPRSVRVVCGALVLTCVLAPGASRAADPPPAPEDAETEEERALRHEVIEWEGDERRAVRRPHLFDPRSWNLE